MSSEYGTIGDATVDRPSLLTNCRIGDATNATQGIILHSLTRSEAHRPAPTLIRDDVIKSGSASDGGRSPVALPRCVAATHVSPRKFWKYT